MGVNHKSFKIVQDTDKAITVMHSAGEWIKDSGKYLSKWWDPENLNRESLLRHAEPDEFFVGLVDEKPAVATIFQLNQRNQDWSSVDKDYPKKALYIHWLSVEREFAGMGLPKLMIDFATHQAQEKNIRLLRLDTNVEEVKLRKIYEDLGFRLVSVAKEDNHKTAFYQKTLD
ncbi:MAG: GNAT family N-acetyltransferase [Candidatus Woykebacteria bacterium]